MCEDGVWAVNPHRGIRGTLVGIVLARRPSLALPPLRDSTSTATKVSSPTWHRNQRRRRARARSLLHSGEFRNQAISYAA
eukprot:11558463-Alexandrium_andersonii.AAC.1